MVFRGLEGPCIASRRPRFGPEWPWYRTEVDFSQIAAGLVLETTWSNYCPKEIIPNRPDPIPNSRLILQLTTGEEYISLRYVLRLFIRP